jgi:hypothetical protein
VQQERVQHAVCKQRRTYEVCAEEAKEHEDGQHAKGHREALVVLEVTKGEHTQDGTCLAAGS